MSRKTREHAAARAAEEAAAQASEAGRILREQRDDVAPAEDPPTGHNDDAAPRVIQPRNDERDNAMRELLERRAQMENEDVQSAPPEAAQKPAATPETPPAAVKPPAEHAATEPPKMVKVKVDGEEFEVPQADIDAAGSVAAYQRDRASDNRLRKTNEALAETRRVQAQITEWLAQNAPKPKAETDDEFIAARVDTLRFGTQEESAKALQEILSRSRPREVDARALTDLAVIRMQEHMAIQQFRQEFADVVANPLLRKLASTLENERKQQLKEIPDWSIFYRTIGNEVRSVLGVAKPAIPPETATPGGPTSQPDKEARKASIVNLPSASARASVPEAPKPETREDILNEMRKQRGIPTG